LGNKLWDKNFAGEGSAIGHSVQQTDDGGFIIAGSTRYPMGGEQHVWLIKTDASGNELWDTIFVGEWWSGGTDVRQTLDGGYIVSGYTNSSVSSYSDAWLIKTDESGNKLWDKIFGSETGDSASSVRETPDGGYIIAGTWAYGEGNSDVWLIKTDPSGNMMWDRTFGGEWNDQGNCIQLTAD